MEPAIGFIEFNSVAAGIFAAAIAGVDGLEIVL